MCMQIPLSNGKYLIVDDQDHERVSKHGWCLGLNNHVVANIKNRTVLLSQFLMGKAPARMGIIHINYDDLDFRRTNLVYVPHCVASQRKARKRNSSSKYKGVRFIKKINRWLATISQNCIPVHIGHFESEIEAARAYDKAALEYYGKYAKLNLPQECYDVA